MDVLETPDRRWRVESGPEGWKVYLRPNPARRSQVLMFGPAPSLDAVVGFLHEQGVDAAMLRPV